MTNDTAWDSLAALVAETTGLSPASLSRDDTIFGLGVDSLGLLKIGQEVEKRFRAELPLAAMADELSTLGATADWLAKNAGTAPAPSPAEPSAEQTPAAQAMIGGVPPPAPSPPSGDARLELAARQMEDFLSLARLQWDAVQSPAGQIVSPPPQNLRGFRLEPDKMDAEQKRFVEGLIARHTARTAASKAHTAKYRPAFADWKHTLGFRATLKEAFYPIVAADAKGGRMRDLDGNEYLDMALGMGVNYLGHAPEYVAEAVSAALAKGMPLGPQNADAGEAAALLRELTGMDRVAWSNTGSEAVMLALRLARAATGRRRVVLFGGSYHGIYDGVLVMSTPDGVAPASAGVSTGAVEDMISLPYGDMAALEKVDALGAELAAVLVEPVQSRKPALQPARFLRRLRRLADKHGFALIFDEMITGFRIHAGGAQAWFGVRADLACYGKILGGGVPVSAVAGAKRFLEGIDGGQWNYGDDSLPSAEASGIVYGGTYCRHPLAMAAVKAVLLHFKKEGAALQERTNSLAARLCDSLNLFFEREEVPVRVERFASQFRFESFGRYNLLLQPLEMDLFFLLLMEMGIYTWERRICFLSTEHDDRDADRIIASVKQAIATLRAGGFDFREKVGTMRRFFPMTPAQLRVFAAMERPGAGLLNHLVAAFAVDGGLDADRLEEAVAAVVLRHEALRTSLHLVDGEAVQKVWAEAPFRLERHEGVSPDEFAARFIRPFDMDRPPLLRAALGRLDDGRTLLAFDLHHAVADGMSLDIIAREVAERYAADGIDAAAPPPQYREFHEDIAGTRHPEATEQLAASWREELASQPPECVLPRPAVDSGNAGFSGGKVFARWDKGRTESARGLAKRHGLTPFMLHAALLGLTLRRLTGAEDLYIGTAAGARPAGAEGTVGMFANTLPLRLRPGRASTLGEYFLDVRKNCLSTFARQGCPFEVIADQAPDKTRPLFTVMLPYERVSGARTSLIAGLAFTPVDLPVAASFYDVNWEIIEEDESTLFKIGYRDAVPGRGMAARILALYDGVFDALTDVGAESVVGGIDGLSADERAWLSTREDVTLSSGTPPPAHPRFAEAWEEALRRENEYSPPALVAPDGTFSRRGLAARAEAMAAELRALGLCRGDRVATLLPPGGNLAAAAIAIWREGGAYMPLDPGHPEARNEELLRRLAPRAVIDGEGRITARSAQGDPSAAPEECEYVFFTSGSTGEPKAVRGMLDGAMHFLAWETSLLGVDDSRVSWLSRPAFDASLRDMFLPLLFGGSSFCPDAETRENPASLARWIVERALTVLHAVPSIFRLIAEAWRDAGVSAPELRWVLLAGEALVGAEVEAWRRLAPNAKFVNLYGPTETTMVKTFAVCDGTLPRGVLPVGQAIPGSRAYIVDAAGMEAASGGTRVLRAPRGAWGEVWLAGKGVTNGYSGMPEATAERFVPDPFNKEGGRAYRTGDCGRWRDDGQLEIWGRLDAQVKIHGVRVDPEETRRALLALPGVGAAVVVAVEDGASQRELAAYFTGGASVETLREGLRSRLPSALVPRHIIPLASLPLTRTGKIDIGLLPPLESGADMRPDASGNAAQLGETASRVRSIFAEVLGCPADAVLPETSFFALGGHSLAAMRLIGKIHAAFGVAPGMADVFRLGTTAALAGFVDARRVDFPASPDRGIAGDDDFGEAEEIVP